MVPLPRLVLLLSGLVLVALGAAFLWSPGLVSAVELVPDSGLARAEVRAMYGGLELGLGVFMFWCAQSPSRWRAGLMAGLWLYIGLAVGRGLGMTMDGVIGPHAWLIAVEIVAIAISCFTLRSASLRAHDP